MGGGSGGGRSFGDIQALVDRAKKELRESAREGRRNVFLSFAYEDIDAVNLLRAQAKNENSPIEFNDWSVAVEINSDRAPYIKQKIVERIAQCSVTVVYLSDATVASAWVDWEVEESFRMKKHVVAVYSGEQEPEKKPEAVIRRRVKCVPWSELSEMIKSLP